MAESATGAAAYFAYGREDYIGIPGAGSLTLTNVVPALKLELKRGENPSPALNRGGFTLRGLPGNVEADVDVGLMMTAGGLIDVHHHILRGGAKAEPETGVFQYTLSGDSNGVSTSYHALLSLDPVTRYYVYGIHFGGIEFEAKGGEPLVARLTGGDALHDSQMSAAEADAGNTGTYTLGPWLRGTLADPSAGDVYVQVSQVSPLQFKVEQTTGSPTFPGSAVDVVLSVEDSLAIWQSLQDHDGADLGIVNENNDPLEIVWPGAAADHGDLAVGDIFRFRAPGTWQAPALSSLSGHQRFTAGHVHFRARPIGSSTWTAYPGLTLKTMIDWPISREQGFGSLYPTAIDRDGELMPKLEVTRNFRSRTFEDFARSHERFEAQVEIRGQQLHTSGLYEGILYDFPSVGVSEREAPVSGRGRVEEKLTLVGEADDAGNSPVEVFVTTPLDHTLAA